MAIINKTGITAGGTIQAEHVTRTIDALSGVSTDTIVATGSFTGNVNVTGSFSGSVVATNLTVNTTLDVNQATITAEADKDSYIDLTLMGSDSGKGFVIPLSEPPQPVEGSMFFGSGKLQIYDGATWQIWSAD